MVFALVKSTSWGWASAKTLGTLAVAFVLIALFVVIERRTKSALVPLSIFRNRSLSVSNMVSLALGASIFSMFYFLSLYMQQVLGYSALKTGVGYLAIAGSIIVAAGAAQSLVAKLGVRLVMTIGMALAAGGLVYFAQISPHGTYVGTLAARFPLGRCRSRPLVRAGDHRRNERSCPERGRCRIGADNDDTTDWRSTRGRRPVDDRCFSNDEVRRRTRPGA